MNRTQIINSIIKRMKARTYLEIGVQRGKNFYQIEAPAKIAVDPEFKIGLTRRLKNLPQVFNNRFFEKTSDTFFEKDASEVFKTHQLDVALIDGLHTYEQSLKDFENCLKYLSPNGVILFHDCNPLSKEAAEPAAKSPEDKLARFPHLNAEWTGDVWKTIVHIRSLFPQIEAFVFDCDFGVGVAKRSLSPKKLKLSASEIEKLSYEDLAERRTEFINLKQPGYLDEFINTL
jgi:hypothetical protein